MSQPKESPKSLFLFQAFCSIFFSVILVSLFYMIYGLTNPILCFFLGFGGSIILRETLGSKIEQTYWWIRIYIELNLKDSENE